MPVVSAMSEYDMLSTALKSMSMHAWYVDVLISCLRGTNLALRSTLPMLTCHERRRPECSFMYTSRKTSVHFWSCGGNEHACVDCVGQKPVVSTWTESSTPSTLELSSSLAARKLSIVSALTFMSVNMPSSLEVNW